MCLFTGQELFRFKKKENNDDDEFGCYRGFDFTPPTGRKHPDDRSVDVSGLVRAGLMSNEDIARRRPFSTEELKDLMAKLAERR